MRGTCTRVARRRCRPTPSASPSPEDRNGMSSHSGGGSELEPPRSDFKDAIGWTALGIAVLVGSLRMDRLESQGINPYTVPGLLPGLLGVAMILLGATLGVRSLRRGALHAASDSVDAGPTYGKRIAIV